MLESGAARLESGSPPKCVVHTRPAAVSLLTTSRGFEIECRPGFLDIGPMRCDFVPSWKVTWRFGQEAVQVRRYLRAGARLETHGLADRLPQG